MKGAGSPSTEVSPKIWHQNNGWCTTSDYIVFETFEKIKKPRWVNGVGMGVSYILIALSVCHVTVMLPVLHFLWQNRPLYITAVQNASMKVS